MVDSDFYRIVDDIKGIQPDIHSHMNQKTIKKFRNEIIKMQ